MTDHTKYPRIYVPEISVKDETATLNGNHAHYLKSVLRLGPDDSLRVFNENDGEWIATIENLSKKDGTASLKEQTRTPLKIPPAVHLLFPPLKKHRLDFLIEKAVELGVTDLHPIVSARTQIRKINAERIQAQIIEAAEQCERLDIPVLHKLSDMDKKIATWTHTPTIICALERENDIQTASTGHNAFLIGPEGGFDDRERTLLLSSSTIQAVSLGTRILRAETAALYCLSLANLEKF